MKAKNLTKLSEDLDLICDTNLVAENISSALYLIHNNPELLSGVPDGYVKKSLDYLFDLMHFSRVRVDLLLTQVEEELSEEPSDLEDLLKDYDNSDLPADACSQEDGAE